MVLVPSRDYSALVTSMLFGRIGLTPLARSDPFDFGYSTDSRPLRGGRRNLNGSRVFRETNRPQDKVLQCSDEKRRIAHGRHHPEDFYAKSLGLFAGLDVDLVKRFDVLGHKRNRHNEHFLAPRSAEPLDCAR